MLTKKERGNSLIVNIMPILFVLPLLLLLFFVKQAQYTKEVIQDAIIESNLAAAIVDIKNFGEKNEIIIEDTNKSLALYQNAIKGNLRLNESFSTKNAIINGLVEITSFIIYNVNNKEGTVTVIDKINNTEIVYKDDEITAPDGSKIMNTSIWSQIKFPTNTFINSEIIAHVGELTDIAVTYEKLRR